ncbi:TPA: DUF4314 domain-containing protein [Streptococcus suis]
MNTLNKKELLSKYPVGTKVKLVFMDDPYAPPVGSIGVIKGIDDLGSIHVQWENHGRLSILPDDIIVLI